MRSVRTRLSSLLQFLLLASVTEVEGGCLYPPDESGHVTVPDGLASIGSYAFDGCTALVSIDLPDSLASIGDYTFYGCTSLVLVALPDSLASIGYGAFYGCTSLAVVYVPEGCSVGDVAFSGTAASPGYIFGRAPPPPSPPPSPLLPPVEEDQVVMHAFSSRAVVQGAEEKDFTEATIEAIAKDVAEMVGVDVDAVIVTVNTTKDGELVIITSIQTPDKASADKALATLVKTLDTEQSATDFLATSTGLDMTATEIDTTAVSLTVVDKEEDSASAVGGIVGGSVSGVVALALLAAAGLKLSKGGGETVGLVATEKAPEGVGMPGNTKI